VRKRAIEMTAVAPCVKARGYEQPDLSF
jgi:hypothetical protein